MNNTLLLGCLVGITHLYWWRRERTVRERLASAREYDTRDAGSTIDTETLTAAQTAAEVVDGRVEDLPETVEALDQKVRDRTTELNRTRQCWAETWWETRLDHSQDSPLIAALSMRTGTLADGKALATQVPTDAIVVVAAQRDESFAVGVGQQWTDTVPATEIGDWIIEESNGKGGGDHRLACGRAFVSETGLERIADRIESTV